MSSNILISSNLKCPWPMLFAFWSRRALFVSVRKSGKTDNIPYGKPDLDF